jgi:glycosyltransferase involved in cell wall biosynthesis
MLPYKLKVIGGGPLLNELKENFSDVEFLGQLDWNSFRPILEGARFMVLPSECSENNPLTVIESQSLGTPVLGSCIGGIPELIEEDVNGMTFEMRNEEDLKNKIKKMWNSSFDYRRIAMTARERYGSETYYDKIMEIYSGK